MLSQVRFNRVPEKIPEKVPEKVGRHWCRVRSGFNRIPEKNSGEGSRRLWCSFRSNSTGFQRSVKPGQVEQCSGKGSGEGVGGLGAKPNQVQKCSKKV